VASCRCISSLVTPTDSLRHWRTSAPRSSISRRSPVPRKRPPTRSRTDDGSPARGVWPDPVARHQDLATGERIAPLREHAGLRARSADGGPAESGGWLNENEGRGRQPNRLFQAKIRPKLLAHCNWLRLLLFLLLQDSVLTAKGAPVGALGCEWAVRASVVSLHGPVTGRRALSRGLLGCPLISKPSRVALDSKPLCGRRKHLEST
jgi:hypothetical protein